MKNSKLCPICKIRKKSIAYFNGKNVCSYCYFKLKRGESPDEIRKWDEHENGDL